MSERPMAKSKRARGIILKCFWTRRKHKRHNIFCRPFVGGVAAVLRLDGRSWFGKSGYLCRAVRTAKGFYRISTPCNQNKKEAGGCLSPFLLAEDFNGNKARQGRPNPSTIEGFQGAFCRSPWQGKSGHSPQKETPCSTQQRKIGQPPD